MVSKAIPFKTKPKDANKVVVGNPVIGEIEIPKLGGLTPNEKMYVKEKTKHLADIQFEIAKLANKISKEQPDISMQKAYETIMEGDTVVLAKYLEEVLKIKSIIDEANEFRPLVYITAILKYRVDKDIDLDTVGDCSPELLVALYDFVMEEQRAESGEVSDKPITEEAIKKS